MSQSRILLILLAVVGLAGVGAWVLFLDDPAPARDGRVEFVGDAERDNDTHGSADRVGADDQPLQDSATSPTARRPSKLEAEDSDDPAAPDTRQPARTAELDPNPASGTRQPSRQTRPQSISAAQREELQREKHGRPALQARLGRTPASASTSGALRRSTKQQEWDEAWGAEGINPPPMVPTPVQGKVMSEQAREGLAKAVVHLMTFFPIDGVAGGPLLPVITDLTADNQGNFKGEIPVSPQTPLNFPLGAIGVSWNTHRVLAAMPLAILEPGKQNALGVFWAPDLPYTLECDASQFSGALSVVSTGEINPQRVHKMKQVEFLRSFPSFNVRPRDADVVEGLPPPGMALLQGTSKGIPLPLISLFDTTTLLQTRLPTLKSSSGSTMGQSVESIMLSSLARLVFENESMSPMGGQVVDAAGAPVAGAVLTTVGGNISQTAITDFAGWFTIPEPHEKTYSLRVQHADFVEKLASAKPGETDLRIVLNTRRPRVRFQVTDKYSFAPITELSFKVVGIHPHGKQKGRNMPAEVVTLQAADGRYTLEWEVEIRNVTLEKLGYFPRLFNNPVKTAEQGGEIAVKLSPGRNLEVTPRDYTAVEDSNRWFKDAQNGPGIYTAWSHHWIEWEVDFGDKPEEGEQGGFFDMVLGATNRGIVDNQYQFTVDVYVDQQKKGTLTIQADSLTIREGRMRLGALSGMHRVRLVWTNDKWIPEQLDANIRYATLKFIEQPK